MATADDLALAVDTYAKAAKSEAVGRINTLTLKASGYFTSTASSNIYNEPIPNVQAALLGASSGSASSIAKSEFIAAAKSVDDRIKSGATSIENIDVPPDILFTAKPLDGWAGVDASISQPWDSVLRISTQLWTGEGLKKAYEIVSNGLRDISADVADFSQPLLDRSSLIYTTLRNNSRTSRNTRLQAAFESELNAMQGFDAIALPRLISTSLEAHSRELYIQLISAGTELDKIDKMFSLKYGEIYSKITEALVAKAGKEVGWFTEDFKARASMMSKSASANNSIYLDTLNGAVDTLVKEVTSNIKAYTTNFEIALNVELEKFKFDRLDKDHQLSLTELDVSIFKSRLNEMYISAAEGMDNYINFHTLEVQAYLALARGYSGLLSTASQGTLAVATSKG